MSRIPHVVAAKTVSSFSLLALPQEIYLAARVLVVVGLGEMSSVHSMVSLLLYIYDSPICRVPEQSNGNNVQ